VHRAGAYRALLIGSVLGLVGFAGMAAFHAEPWEFIFFGTLSQLTVTIGFAALPALLVQAVEPADTGVANSVNSIARSVGSAVASALIPTPPIPIRWRFILRPPFRQVYRSPCPPGRIRRRR
jgi:MFS family permease